MNNKNQEVKSEKRAVKKKKRQRSYPMSGRSVFAIRKRTQLIPKHRDSSVR